MNGQPVDDLVQSPGQVFRSRPIRVAMVVTLLGVGVHWAPASWGPLRFFRQPDAPQEALPEASTEVDALGEAELKTETRAVDAMAAPAEAARAAAPQAPLFGGAKEAPATAPRPEATSSLVDPTGHSLDHFFSALASTEKRTPGAVTRVAHFGDSIVVSDYVSGTARRLFQKEFGDAGHGYMLIANAWPAYFHNDVFRYATSGFRVSRIVGPLTSDGWYGLGGVTFRASAGVVAEFGTADKGDFGRNVSKFVLSYLEYPGGGQLLLDVDGKPAAEIETNGATKVVRRHTLEVADGPHRFRLRVKGAAETRLFGVVLERDGPGVVVDALGVQGARIRFLDKQDDAHFKDELQWRSPQLVVYQFGANESGDGYAYSMADFSQTMKAVVAQTRAALPRSSCLVIGAMDRARVENGQVTSMKIIPLIIAEQRKAAAELGCAYFDTYGAMGGWGSMPSWVKRGLVQADMTHPTLVGAERIAGWIYQALMEKYRAFKTASTTP